jgi:hypothetical protein
MPVANGPFSMIPCTSEVGEVYRFHTLKDARWSASYLGNETLLQSSPKLRREIADYGSSFSAR